MSWDEIKDEKEGYVRVRKSDDRALIGRLKKENDDPEAKGYIELNKDDLGGMGGGGGPHSHSEYASKTHDHDTTHDHDNDYQAKGNYASGDHTHDTTHNHNGLYSATTHLHDLNYADKTLFDDHLANHPSGGGESYDDSWIQPALDDKSDTTHIHDAVPAHQHPHDHNADYAGITHTHTDVPGHNHSDYANTIHGHDEFMVLQNQINDKAAEDHVHDDAGTRFDPTYLEQKDAEEDARIEALEESQEEQNARLDALEEGMGGDDCILGRYIRNDFFYHNGGAQAQDYYLKLHKPTDNYGDDSNQGDLDNRDIDKNMSGIEIGDTVWLIVGDNVHEIVLDAKQDMSHYYGYRFNTRVESLIPKDAEFLLQSAETCGEEEVAEHEHEGMVVSDSVASIVKISQADFDALADKDASTLYLVV